MMYNMIDSPQPSPAPEHWAQCQEPYKTHINRLTSQWVNGSVTNSEMALRLWDVWFKMSVKQHLAHRPILHDVQSHVEALANTLMFDQAKFEELKQHLTREERLQLLGRNIWVYCSGDQGPSSHSPYEL
jgi:hypothetical protein